MLSHNHRPQIEKVRHIVKDAGNSVTWEIDEFLGDNQGLIVAEVELNSEDQVCCVLLRVSVC